MNSDIATGILILCMSLGFASCRAVESYERVEMAKIECTKEGK